jgi:hypothetical protein
MEITYIVGLVQCWVGIQNTLGYHSGIPIWTSQGISFSDALTETLITGSHLHVNWMLQNKFKCWNPGEIKPLTQVNDNRFSLVWELDAPKTIQMLKPESNKTSYLGQWSPVLTCVRTRCSKKIQMLIPGWSKTSDLGGVLKFMYLSNTGQN